MFSKYGRRFQCNVWVSHPRGYTFVIKVHCNLFVFFFTQFSLKRQYQYITVMVIPFPFCSFIIGYTAREKFRCMQLWSLYVFLYHRIINFKGNWHSELRDKHTSFNQVFIIKIKKMDEWKRRAKCLYKEDSEKLKYRQIWLFFLKSLKTMFIYITWICNP